MQTPLPRPDAARSSSPHAAAMRGPRLHVLVAASALLLGVAYLVLTAVQTSTVYYLTVGELLDRGPSAYGQQIRVAGDVAPGSVQTEDAGLTIRFVVQDANGRVPVYYRGGPVPDIFGEEVQVVVEGKYGPDGTFVAQTLLAKCPSKFDTQSEASV